MCSGSLINPIEEAIKILSCNAISKLALARTTPVNPPIVNNAKNPITNNNGVVYLRLPP